MGSSGPQELSDSACKNVFSELGKLAAGRRIQWVLVAFASGAIAPGKLHVEPALVSYGNRPLPLCLRLRARSGPQGDGRFGGKLACCSML
jgi:hypothetical protein